ncbi:MAG TPA: LysR family transcriptional regulator [Candidatus Binatia bacterium]|jgi:DNA-binding transcriptional LysR family regulator
MTLWQFKVFLTVAKIGSFTQAGKALNVNQSSVTAVIRSLARELEVKLFEKVGVRAHLTRAGEELVPLARDLLDKAAGIKERMVEVDGLHKGSIAVGGAGVAAATFLLGAIDDFKNKHPGIKVALKIEATPALEKDLLEGQLDLAILGRAPQSPLVAGEFYAEEDVVAIAAPDHPLAKKRFVPLDLLAREQLVIRQEGDSVSEMVKKKFASEGYTIERRLEVVTDFGGRDIVKSAVVKGVGIGFIARCHIVGDAQAGRVKILKLPKLNLKRSMYIATHKKRQTSALVPVFVEFLRDYKKKTNHKVGRGA